MALIDIHSTPSIDLMAQHVMVPLVLGVGGRHPTPKNDELCHVDDDW